MLLVPQRVVSPSRGRQLGAASLRTVQTGALDCWVDPLHQLSASLSVTSEQILDVERRKGATRSGGNEKALAGARHVLEAGTA